MRKALVPLLCLITLHDPSGGLITIDIAHIAMVRSTEELAGQHLAAGSNAVIYLPGHRVAVTETRETVEDLIDRCGD